MASSSETSPTEEKAHDLEAVQTNEPVPGHRAYHDKDGLRTYGDDADHDHEPPVSLGLASYQSRR